MNVTARRHGNTRAKRTKTAKRQKIPRLDGAMLLTVRIARKPQSTRKAENGTHARCSVKKQKLDATVYKSGHMQGWSCQTVGSHQTIVSLGALFQRVMAAKKDSSVPRLD